MIQKSILAGIFLTCLIFITIFEQKAVVPGQQAFDSSALIPAGSTMAITADSLNNIQAPDSINGANTGCLQETEPDLFRMPIFKPDTSLTASMPVLIPPPVDEGMIVPFGTPSPEKCE